MRNSKRHLLYRLRMKKKKEESKEQYRSEKRITLARYVCLEMVKRGIEVPTPFDELFFGEEEESDRRKFV